jgi:hypothetical protein
MEQHITGGTARERYYFMASCWYIITVKDIIWRLQAQAWYVAWPKETNVLALYDTAG